MAKQDFSFDIVSEVSMPEVANAVDQARREIAQRFDFKDTGTSISQDDQLIEVRSSTEDRLKAAVEVLKEKAVKRQVSLKALHLGPVQPAAERSLATDDQPERRDLGGEGARAREVRQGPQGQGPEPRPGRPGQDHAARPRTICRS